MSFSNRNSLSTMTRTIVFFEFLRANPFQKIAICCLDVVGILVCVLCVYICVPVRARAPRAGRYRFSCWAALRVAYHSVRQSRGKMPY